MLHDKLKHVTRITTLLLSTVACEQAPGETKRSEVPCPAPIALLFRARRNFFPFSGACSQATSTPTWGSEFPRRLSDPLPKAFEM